jgi:HSP20 family molecular chaperone IbpA
LDARAFKKMSRIVPFASSLFLGFESFEKNLERIVKANDGYPPYNIERVLPDQTRNLPERLRITLAVAGFGEDELEIIRDESQLVIKGRQSDQAPRDYLHRGIAARQFQRMFLLAEGMEVLGANLKNGLLSIDLIRPEVSRIVKKINIFVPE